ncbi:MAG: PAS domain-containing protein [Rubrivivax sp.]|nr:PAS domain-containing protein [Rubrivivax sp.]
MSSDIALVIDETGIVTSVAQNEHAPMSAAAQAWVGQPWAATVTGDTRSKIESLLADATAGGLGRRREVNLASEPGTDLPVAYTALRLGEHGPVLAVGRDLRSMAAIQQRFLETQQALERSYWRARHDEVRHRLLYQVATDAVLTVDSRDLSLVTLNANAIGLLQADGGAAPGGPLPQQFEARSRPAVAALLVRALVSNEAVEGLARLAGSHASVNLVASRLPGATGSSLVLLRLRSADPPQDDPLAVGSALARHVDGTSEAIVVTDAQGQVREANLAFVQMAQAADLAAVLGRPLETWLPGSGQAVVRSVYEQGLATHQRVVLRRRDTTRLPLDMAGALLADVAGGDAGFTLRPCGTDTLAADARAAALVQAIDALAAELGSLPLPELLQQAQVLASRHLVLTALDRHTGDPAAAARLLGISPEQLAELRREAGSDSPQHPR